MAKVIFKEIGTKNFYKKLESLRHIDLTDCGEIVRKQMVNTIEANRTSEEKKPSERYRGQYTKHLRDVIKIVVDENGVGIGDVEELNRETPYWYKINYGGKAPGPTHGWFSDGPPLTTTGGGHALTVGKGPSVVPDVAISPMNYIEKTGTWTQANIWKYVVKAIERNTTTWNDLAELHETGNYIDYKKMTELYY
jgi:hypothetical protein